MKSESRFPYTIAIVPYLLILALSTLWFFIVIPPFPGDIPIRFSLSNQPEWYVHRMGFVIIFIFVELVIAGGILYFTYCWDNRLDTFQKEFQSNILQEEIDLYRKSKNTLSFTNLFFYFLLVLTLFNYNLFYYQLRLYLNPISVAIISISIIFMDLFVTFLLLHSKEKSISQFHYLRV